MASRCEGFFAAKTGSKAGADCLFVEISPDKDDFAETMLAFAPRPARSSLQRHMHTVKDEATLLATKGNDAFHSEQILPDQLDQIVKPRI